MWRLKGCIRCEGDVFIDHDEYGWYEVCILCGCYRELDILTERGKWSAEKGREPAPATQSKNRYTSRVKFAKRVTK